MVVMDMDVVDTKTNTKTQTKANTKCFKDPMFAIFLKVNGFKDFKYDMDMDMSDMDVMDMDVVDTQTNTKTQTMTKTNTFRKHLQRVTPEFCDH